jgi:hypothetical protein
MKVYWESEGIAPSIQLSSQFSLNPNQSKDNFLGLEANKQKVKQQLQIPH